MMIFLYMMSKHSVMGHYSNAQMEFIFISPNHNSLETCSLHIQARVLICSMTYQVALKKRRGIAITLKSYQEL